MEWIEERFRLHESLSKASKKNILPSVTAYNRIDGPGSSLDLREFQQAFWSLPKIPRNIPADSAMKWTSRLPRTIGITIDVGTKIEAHPFEKDSIGVRSLDYKFETVAKAGEVPPTKENWLLKILDIFCLTGVVFVIKNLQPDIQSSGLGGSATATTGVCILANKLAGSPFSEPQLISMASRMEQDLGVSITGLQEQSNVVFGGVRDYIWFPWGIPGQGESGYGASLRLELIPQNEYIELEKRMAIFHTGRPRSSTNVNTEWRNALFSTGGYKTHANMLGIAYQYREGLRRRDWNQVLESIRRYREIRTSLCSAYMDGAQEISEFAESKRGVAFPLGAGGGGGALIFSPNPESLADLRTMLRDHYKEINFNIIPKGHIVSNL